MAAAVTLPNGESTDTVKWHRERFDALCADRRGMLPHWKDVHSYILPSLVRSFDGKRRKSYLDYSDVIDTTATQALHITAAGMMAGITSPARRWLRTAPPKGPGEQTAPDDWWEWNQHLDDELFRFWNETSLYSVLPGIYEELLGFGTAAGFGSSNAGIGESEFVWGQVYGGEYAIAEDNDGMVRTLYRKFEKTVKQLAEEYGGRNVENSKLSGHVKQLWRSGMWNERVDILAVLHRTPTISYLMGADMPLWEQVVMEYNTTSGMDDVPGRFLARNRFETYPAWCVRWDSPNMTPWGVGPGMDAVPDVRQLQEMEEKKAAALTLQIDPPMVADAALSNQRMSTLPGDVTFVPGMGVSGKPGFAPAYQVQPRLQDFEHSMEMVRARIRRIMHSDLFLSFIERPGIQPLNESEIWERKEEKLLGLGQTLNRVDREMIRPIVAISMDELRRRGRLQDPPEGYTEFDIEYLNVIAVAQKTQGLTAIADITNYIAGLAKEQSAAGLTPTAWDHFNERFAVKSFAEKRGVDTRILVTEEEVDELQQARAEAQQAQQELAESAQAATMAKDVAAAEELSARTQQDQGPLATGGGPGRLPPAGVV